MFPPLTYFSLYATGDDGGVVGACTQRVFSKYSLSLSCLYALKGSAVSVPLDPHYISMVHGFLRDNMWASIRKEGEDMQQHIALMEEKFETMKVTLSSIYKSVCVFCVFSWCVCVVLKIADTVKYVFDCLCHCMHSS